MGSEDMDIGKGNADVIEWASLERCFFKWKQALHKNEKDHLLGRIRCDDIMKC